MVVMPTLREVMIRLRHDWKYQKYLYESALNESDESVFKPSTDSRSHNSWDRRR